MTSSMTQRIAIIGGGLAGCAAAYHLAQAGTHITLYEQASTLHSGASGNAIGLYNPRFFATYSPEAAFYDLAFAAAIDLFSQHGKAFDHTPCGALHLMNTQQKHTRFHKMAQSWKHAKTQHHLLPQHTASEHAGLPLPCDALYLPQSGTVSPTKLCQFYTQHPRISIQLQIPINDTTLNDLQAQHDAVILANAYQISKLKASQHLPLKPVRGQITHITATPQTMPLQMVLCYGGYITPHHQGQHTVGSSFERGVSTADYKDSDDQDTLTKLSTALPSLKGPYQITAGRASVRTTAPDHRPIIGQLQPNLYVSTAHGSHGLLSSLMAAQIITAQITGQRPPVSQATLHAVSPHRM